MTSCKVLHRLTPYKHDLKQYMKKCVQKREKTWTVKSLNNVRFMKNQSSVKLLEINEPNYDVIQRVLDRSQKMYSLTHDPKQYMKKWEEIWKNRRKFEKMGGNLKKIGGDTEKKRVQKREKHEKWKVSTVWGLKFLKINQA